MTSLPRTRKHKHKSSTSNWRHPEAVEDQRKTHLMEEVPCGIESYKYTLGRRSMRNQFEFQWVGTRYPPLKFELILYAPASQGIPASKCLVRCSTPGYFHVQVRFSLCLFQRLMVSLWSCASAHFLPCTNSNVFSCFSGPGCLPVELKYFSEVPVA